MDISCVYSSSSRILEEKRTLFRKKGAQTLLFVAAILLVRNICSRGFRTDTFSTLFPISAYNLLDFWYLWRLARPTVHTLYDNKDTSKTSGTSRPFGIEQGTVVQLTWKEGIGVNALLNHHVTNDYEGLTAKEGMSQIKVCAKKEQCCNVRERLCHICHRDKSTEILLWEP
jgi:hypothetical protein